MQKRAWLCLGCAVIASAGCSRKTTAPAAVTSARKAERPPVDHLAPGELAPSQVLVYGFPVPRGMEVESRLSDRAYVSGRVSPEALSNYVREQLVVSHVEIGAARTVFPAAHIKGGPEGRIFNLEVLPDGPRTRLVIKDVTPPPPPPPGLTDAERWRAAGLTPDGRPLDPKQFE